MLFLFAALALSSTPWPKPQSMTVGANVLMIPSKPNDFAISVEGTPTAALKTAINRVKHSIITGNGDGCGSAKVPQPNTTGTAWIKQCSISIGKEDGPLGPGADESYELDITVAGDCHIRAPMTWGAIHALESLAQLAGENCTVNNAPININDKPRFGFRGLMIDTARHYMPVQFIEHIIDGMAALKLNVMHWHIVDSQSFPYVSELFPGLSGKGAYSPRATYTATELKGLVAYAEARAVRIMPEFDMPGHGDWEQGEPKIMVLDGPCKNTMNPTEPSTYTFLAKFLKEVTTIFNDEYIFLGGDEVSGECWSGSPTVQAWMTAHNMNSSGLGRYFWQQMTKQVLPHLNKTLGVWEDDAPQPHPDDLPKGSFGNIWQAQSTIASATGRKFDAVLSGPWYLDQQKPGGCNQYSLEGMWECFYNVDPLTGLTPADAKYVLGGQACQWSEGINQHNFDARTWTNAAAVAERLWSPLPLSVHDAQPRLIEQVCRLNSRGYGANPIDPSFCPTGDFLPKREF